MRPLRHRLREITWPRLGLAVLACAGLLWFAPLRAAAQQVRTEIVLSGLSSPTFVTHAGDARLFIVERAGRVRIYDTVTHTLLTTPFVDLSAKVSGGGERGLFSIAFHPDFATNRYFYVNYTNLGGHTVIERYQASATPNIADAASATQLMLITQPFANHNGGQLQIGPQDGHLYIGMGDGGSSGDPQCHGQNPGSYLGKMLRLDVRQNLNTPPYYGIPSDNPFRAGASDPGNTIPDEIWALGLRNPWRFSFDRQTGNLYIADVGQGAWEEIDLHRAGTASGENYGWNVMEGNHCYSNSCGGGACNSPAFTYPIFEYDHSVGCSITGGYVSRGPNAPALSGRYVYSDYCQGTFWALRESSPGVFQNSLLLDLGDNIVSFGEGNTGRLFALGNSTLYELVSDPVAPPVSVPAAPVWALLVLASGLLLVTAALAGSGCRRGSS